MGINLVENWFIRNWHTSTISNPFLLVQVSSHPYFWQSHFSYGTKNILKCHLLEGGVNEIITPLI